MTVAHVVFPLSCSWEAVALLDLNCILIAPYSEILGVAPNLVTPLDITLVKIAWVNKNDYNRGK